MWAYPILCAASPERDNDDAALYYETIGGVNLANTIQAGILFEPWHLARLSV